MLQVLIIEDDAEKYGRVFNALRQHGVEERHIVHKVNGHQALAELRKVPFDLVLLDVNIPRRLGEGPVRGGGIEVLKELERDPAFFRPSHVVGMTQYEDVIEEFGEAFSDHLWSLVHYREDSSKWVEMLKIKLDYIRASKNSRNFSDGQTYGVDLAIVCALEGVELQAIRRLPCDWQAMKFAHDETRYLSGSISRDQETFSVIAASAPRMGMPSAAVLSSKIIQQFRPRYLAMVGICAGRASKCNIGDVIIADPTWDWGSGKVESKGKRPMFSPSPHQIALDVDLRNCLMDLVEDKPNLARVKQDATGKKPPYELSAHVAPMVSGASVVSDKSTFDSLLDQHRNIYGLEMEAYGVASAAMGNGRPRPCCLIMKSVCDYADEDKDDDYQEYAASVSAGLLLSAAKRFL